MITEFYTEYFRVFSSKISKFCTIDIFRNFVKESNKSNKTFRHVHGLFTVPHFIYLSTTLNDLPPRSMNTKFQLPTMFVFLVFNKNCLIESCSSFKDLSA
jgi:hypothetical protein